MNVFIILIASNDRIRLARNSVLLQYPDRFYTQNQPGFSKFVVMTKHFSATAWEGRLGCKAWGISPKLTVTLPILVWWPYTLLSLSSATNNAF